MSSLEIVIFLRGIVIVALYYETPGSWHLKNSIINGIINAQTKPPHYSIQVMLLVYCLVSYGTLFV